METLYRKYRSQTFGELVGQKQATQILRNAIRRGRLSHAYLFCGPRGTGKTSVARIFAKALCCLDPQDGDCCGKCAHCVQVAQGQALDVQEIDAASKNKVDDIRELRDRVGYAPAQFPYKVYIIDEVHMVTPQGFNALLKTLEEPPPHVKFLLCTTEAHKLPVTILSRCIRLDFTRIALPELAAHLQWIAGQEGFALDEDAALELAALAEGSARDAISLLDQLTVYCEGTIARADVRELFQLGDPELVPNIVKAIAADNKRELLDTWERLAGQGADAGRFLLQVAAALKDCYIESGEPGWRRALEAVWQGLNLLKQESFPALLVELSLLQAAEGYANPVAVAHDPDRGLQPAAGTGGLKSANQSAARKPEFLRKANASSEGSSGAGAPARALPAEENGGHGGPPHETTVGGTEDGGGSPPPLGDSRDAALQHPPSPEQTTQPDSRPERTLRSSVPTTPPPVHDPQYSAYLAELKQRSLPAYVLAGLYAQPALKDGVLELGFDPARHWARPACAFAQHPELLDALAAAAQQSAYAAARLRVGILGEEGGWKTHGGPFDLPARETNRGLQPALIDSGPDSANQDSGQDKLPGIFARKAGKGPSVHPSPDETFSEPEADEAQIVGAHSRPRPDPRELASGVEVLGKQIDKAAPPTATVENPATVEDVLELFGGKILED